MLKFIIILHYFSFIIIFFQFISGSCVCETGFINFDCSVNATVRPIITSLDKELYNEFKGDRSSVGVLGHGFVNSDTLKCNVRALQVCTPYFYFTFM
jgi:hypothetical protein